MFLRKGVFWLFFDDSMALNKATLGFVKMLGRFVKVFKETGVFLTIIRL